MRAAVDDCDATFERVRGSGAEVVQEHPDDISAYTAGKRAFVARVLRDAGIELGGYPDGSQ